MAEWRSGTESSERSVLAGFFGKRRGAAEGDTGRGLGCVTITGRRPVSPPADGGSSNEVSAPAIAKVESGNENGGSGNVNPAPPIFDFGTPIGKGGAPSGESAAPSGKGGAPNDDFHAPILDSAAPSGDGGAPILSFSAVLAIFRPVFAKNDPFSPKEAP